jgi:formylglycine-generating enzyme
MARGPLALLGLSLLGGAGVVALACSLSGLADGGAAAGAAGSGASAGSAGCEGVGCAGAGGGAGAGGCDGGGGCAGGDGGVQCGDGECGGGCPPCTLGRACNVADDCKSKRCETNVCACPLDMVAVPTPISEGTPYCVDALEVTNQQYQAFLGQKPDPTSQPPECAWNSDFVPPLFAEALATKPAHPVVNVDWCDARAYCAAAGKRLCGKLGGGAHVYTLPQSATNEWYVACSQAGKHTFVYGNTYATSACVTKDYYDGGAGSPLEVGSVPGCEGGYPGLFDMNGNVWEWEDSCSDVDGGDAAVAPCRRRGGAFDDTQSCARCATCGSASRARNNRSGATGIRCCAG